jgi:hypothetical protein
MLGMASQPIFALDCRRKSPRPQPHPYDAAYVALAEAMRAALLTRPVTRQSSRSPLRHRNSAGLAPSLSIRGIHRHWGDFRPRLTDPGLARLGVRPGRSRPQLSGSSRRNLPLVRASRSS